MRFPKPIPLDITCPIDNEKKRIWLYPLPNEEKDCVISTGCDDKNNSAKCQKCIKDYSFPNYSLTPSPQFHDWPEAP